MKNPETFEYRHLEDKVMLIFVSVIYSKFANVPLPLSGALAENSYTNTSDINSFQGDNQFALWEQGVIYH